MPKCRFVYTENNFFTVLRSMSRPSQIIDAGGAVKCVQLLKVSVGIDLTRVHDHLSSMQARRLG